MALDERMTGILKDLEPSAEAELNRHLETAKPWNPHEWINWDEGTNYVHPAFKPEDWKGKDWDPTQTHVREVAQKALILNLLTEDNLPSYFLELTQAFDESRQDGPWNSWVGQWTAEEARHAVAMRDFLVVSRAADPIALETARIPHMRAGYKAAKDPSDEKSPLDVTAYVTMQELATAISHDNTGRLLMQDGYEWGGKLMQRIAADERLHYLFYLNIGSAAFEQEPDLMMQSFVKEAATFDMPGKDTIPNYKEDAREIAEAGIYSYPLHIGRVLKPIMKHWNILDMSGLSGDGAKAQQLIGESMEAVEAKAEKLSRIYAEKAAKKAEQEV
jgi:acyl-[acyl-carrier-protein] desaturase